MEKSSKIDFNAIIETLLKERNVFHSEDDLKLSLALAIKETYSNVSVRLERPVDIEMIDREDNKIKVRAPIDIIIVEEDGNTIPIELKYKTKEDTISLELKCKTKDEETFHKEELYNLVNHGAYPVGRYSFRKDIYRIEKYLSEEANKNSFGFVFILTNDSAYWDKDVSKTENLDKNYSFHNGYTLELEDKGWNSSTYNGTWTQGEKLSYNLTLKNEYKIQWNTFGKNEEEKKNGFKYCLIEIPPPSSKEG